MQLPNDVTALAALPGPFATVYLDITRSVEQAVQEIDLRWHALRHELQDAGAPADTLAAIGAAVGRPDAPGERGQVIVATRDTVVFDHVLPRRPRRDPVAFAPVLPRRPRRDEARWAPLPHLVPYLAALLPATPYVAVSADRTGADLTAVAGIDAAELVPAGLSARVDGSEPYPITKTSVRDPSEHHFQQRVENSWVANARDVAAAVGEQVSAVEARIVVLTGDSRARALLRTDLPHVLHPDVDVLDAPDGDVPGALLRHSWHERRQVLDHLAQNLGRGQYAVAGSMDVLTAVRRAQVDTLVLSDDPSSTLAAWVGPEPMHLALDRDELSDMGVAEPQRDRYDAALLRALAGSGAGIVVTPNAHEYVRDGIAALLRYTDAATPRRS